MHNPPPRRLADLGASKNSGDPACLWSSMLETSQVCSLTPRPHICDLGSACKKLAFGNKAGVVVLGPNTGPLQTVLEVALDLTFSGIL